MSISDLVKKYDTNRDTYLESAYNETQLRADFLDPFFELLGWDIKNSQGKPTNEREVLLEESLKKDANSNTKKPDYTFRLYSERKFFVEAKKPSVKINSNSDSAKQVRRYGFTAKLKISVLSNFEYLAIYDCSSAVSPSDPATLSRISIYHYTEYEAAFEDIKAQLGKEEVYDGSFDEVWKDIEDQLKLSSVDDLFLAQINDWRLTLGAEIFSHKPELSDEHLNDLVQRYINSLIFLRVCEDRDLEVYKALLSCVEADNFNALITIFSDADKKYNAGLFDHEMVEEIITSSRSAFWTIIKQLYFPESAYSFSVFASDILGNIYEIFLGQQLRNIEGHIELVNKPEHEDRDIVTTPTFIIQDILRETVSKFCEGKTDTQILQSKFADIACGSGAFLLEVYQLLHDTLVDYYLKHDAKALIQTSVETHKLPFKLKRKLIESCIFGIDKDYNAVEACKFGLLLKLLENEVSSSIPAPALPNIDDNIQFGNSLISPDLISDDKASEINPYDFGDMSFDVIVGNPPYMATEHMKAFTPLELPVYKAHYTSAFKQFDKYYLFIERGLTLLKDNGYFGYIIPSKFTKVGAATKLRQHLKTSKHIKKIISFGANQVFDKKTTYTCLLFLKKTDHDAIDYLEVQNLKNWKIRNVQEDDYDNLSRMALNDQGWVLVPGPLKPVYKKILDQSITLETLIGSDAIYNGIQTSANNTYIHRANKSDDTYFYFKKDKIDWQFEKELTRPYFKTSGGIDNLNTYRPFAPNSFVIYPYIKTERGLELVPLDQLKDDYPHAYKYLMHYRAKLDNDKRDIKPTPETQNEWHRYGRHQSLEKCDVPAKIVVGVLSQGNKYAIDYFGTLISSGGTAGYCMITPPDEFDYSIYYIQAVLNSKYLEWCSALMGEVFRGGYIARGTKVLKKLPIRTIDFTNDKDKALHDRIAKCQKQLIKMQGNIDKAQGDNRKLVPMNRSFSRLKTQLDEELKSLYGLKDDDSLIPMISEVYATN